MPEQEDHMSDDMKQLRLQLKERDARISQLEASEKHWKQEFNELEAEVLACMPMVRKAREVLEAYTTGLTVLTAIAEQTKDA